MTGATGFIGSRLLERLVAEGISIRAPHRRAPGLQHTLIEWCPAARLDNQRELALLVAGVDTVIHLAGLAHQIGLSGQGRWEEFQRTNALVTGMLATASASAGVRRVIFLSSIAVMGITSDTPLNASMQPMPATDYGRSKLEGEAALEHALQGSQTDWCIIRPPVVYGPSNPGNMQRLLRLIGTGMPLPFGAIHNRRSFMFIDNLVDALVSVMRFDGPIRDRFVIGDGTDFSTPDLVRALAAASRRRVRVLPVPVFVLRALAHCADLAGKIIGKSLPFDSYSVDRLRESLHVDPAPFYSRFAWRPPVDTVQALEITCRSLDGVNTR